MLLQVPPQDRLPCLRPHPALQDGRAPLHLAALSGCEQVLALLLGANADVNLTDKSGMTALHKAATLGHSRAVKLLLQRGGDPHILMEVRQPEGLLVNRLWLHSWGACLAPPGTSSTQGKRVRQHCLQVVDIVLAFATSACKGCPPAAAAGAATTNV